MSPRKRVQIWYLNRRLFLKTSLLSLISASSVSRAWSATISITAIIKGVPTSSSAVIAVSIQQDLKFYVEYGYSSGSYSAKSAVYAAKKGSTTNVTLSGLKADSKVFARIRYIARGGKSYLIKTLPTFMTSAASSSLQNRTFAIQADPHMDENSDANIYKGTLSQVVAANPAFLMDLGDIFMVDKLPQKTEANIRARFELMKSFYGILFILT